MPFEALVDALATRLEMCLQAALGVRPNPPAQVCSIPGESFQLMLSAGTAEDVCCAGFAAVRVAGVTPRYERFGEFVSPCGIDRWRVDFEMGVARCAPVGDIGSGPSCPQWRAVAELVKSDMGAMVEALCCFQQTPEVGGAENTTATGWLPFGPEGACTGGIMGVSVLVGACQCPESEV